LTAAPWLTRVERRVTRWAASGLGPAWVVAVSGGGDSVGLLRVLHAVAPGAGLTLSVAHLDHGARGEASRADAAFVADLARSLGLPCDTGHWAATRPGHFEADARRARYAWLAGVARARGATALAVGHTRDDQAETVLHRVLRGTGLRGLAGIPARRALGDGLTLVRPVLTVSRDEVRDHLAGLGQPFRDDPTNADPARTRARLRHDLLPKLAADYNPQIADALVRLARLAGASTRAGRDKILEMERFALRDVQGDHDRVAFVRDRLMQYPAFFRAEVLRLAWRRAGWPEAGMSAKRWRRLARLVRRTRPGRFDVGGGVVAETSSMLQVPDDSSTWALTFSLRRADAPQGSRPYTPVSPEALPLQVPGSAAWPDGRVVVTDDPDGPPHDEAIDLDRLYPPLWVRAPLPGDKFNPLGMGDRETPLNDFFRGRQVPRDRRARTPLVCDRLGIVWVVGHRIAHRVRLTESTTRRAWLRWEAAGDHRPPSCG